MQAVTKDMAGLSAHEPYRDTSVGVAIIGGSLPKPTSAEEENVETCGGFEMQIGKRRTVAHVAIETWSLKGCCDACQGVWVQCILDGMTKHHPSLYTSLRM